MVSAAMIEPAAPGEVRVRRALLSVSDKTGVVEFARGLSELGDRARLHRRHRPRSVRCGHPGPADRGVHGFPEMMDGRVKTLHPRLYAGLLALRDDDSHLQAASEHGIEPVDLVCVNLYPFEQTLARGDASEAEIIENIDIGGPTMIRAAAKNSAFAAVLVDPEDYAPVLAQLRESGGRISLADPHTAGERRRSRSPPATTPRSRPGSRARAYEGFPPIVARRLREGDRTCATARTLTSRPRSTPAPAPPTHLLQGVTQLHGKELSFNNLLDLSSARELVEELDGPACAIVKHNNPCGCAVGETIESGV